jgi:DNA invertase Pin-like site-specific DNA recombinase
MLYFAYHRTSTEDQHLDRGLNAISDFIVKEGIELINEIHTDQCTGKNFDRLGRNKQLTLKEIRMMQDKGIRLIVLEIPTCQMIAP